MRDRAWLRKIVNLSARAREERIPREVIELQEDTVLAALDKLKREPGVLLADEVGMGKTFQTLAIIACAIKKKRSTRVLVVTPTPQLNEQWYWYGHRFREHGFFNFEPGMLAMAKHLRDLPMLCREHNVVFAPMTIFSSVRAKRERGFLLKLWARRNKLPSRQVEQIRRRIQKAGVDIELADSFLDYPLRHFAKSSLRSAFKRPRRDARSFLGLDDLYANGLPGFDSAVAVRRAFTRARFHVLRSLMQPLSFLVVDEAHKLKNPYSVRAQAVSQTLAEIYDRAIFLTATPFQLGLEELRHVFKLFGSARRVRRGFHKDVEELYQSVQQYQATYQRFEEVWRYVTVQQARDFGSWYAQARRERRPESVRIDDPNVQLVSQIAQSLLELKRMRVEPAFRQFMLRSFKPGKRARREMQIALVRPTEQALGPTLIHQRMTMPARSAGKAPGGGTRDIGIASSFEAAKKSLQATPGGRKGDAAVFRPVLQQTLATVRDDHPKLAHVVEDVIGAALAGDKTLIFSERIASIRALQGAIEKRWRDEIRQVWHRACPEFSFEQIFGAGDVGQRGISQRIPPRFYRSADELSVVFADQYAHTLFTPELGISDLRSQFWRSTGELLSQANTALERCRVPASTAMRFDYGVAARCIDQAVAQWYAERRPRLVDREPMVAHLLEPEYPSRGFPFSPTHLQAKGVLRKPNWEISGAAFSTILAPRRMGIWFEHRTLLSRFEPEIRHLIVEAVRYFLTRQESSFLAELIEEIGDPKVTSGQVRSALEVWWTQGKCRWRQKVSDLLEYLPCLTVAEQKAVLHDLLHSPRVVQNLLSAKSRITRQNAFNAPFYPMVIIGNATIQQGLDLHRQCRRVLHHDLRWNPNDLEQRIGRVERHGSLAEKHSASHPEGKIKIIYPLTDKTDDPDLYREVRLREKWMSFLMGNPATLKASGAGLSDALPLPEELISDLRIELGPTR